LKAFGVDKSREEIQQFIDDPKFTLLFEAGTTTSNLHLENLESPKDQKRSYVNLMKRQFKSARASIRNWLSGENMDYVV